MQNLRTRLREGTREAHAELDRQLVPGAQAAWDAPACVRYLRVVDAVERFAADSRAWTAARAGLPDLGPAVRRAVAADLRRLGAPREGEGAPAGGCDGGSGHDGHGAGPCRAGAAPWAHWGRAYVLEGAALGARGLRKVVGRGGLGAPGRGSLDVLDVLAGPEADEQRWPRFVAAVDHAGQEMDPEAWGVAVASARGVFALGAAVAARGHAAWPAGGGAAAGAGAGGGGG